MLFSTRAARARSDRDVPVQGAGRRREVSVRLHVPRALEDDERRVERGRARWSGPRRTVTVGSRGSGVGGRSRQSGQQSAVASRSQRSTVAVIFQSRSEKRLSPLTRRERSEAPGSRGAGPRGCKKEDSDVQAKIFPGGRCCGRVDRSILISRCTDPRARRQDPLSRPSQRAPQLGEVRADAGLGARVTRASPSPTPRIRRT